MHPRMQEVLDYMDEQYAAFRATAGAVPPGDRERQPADGCWTVAQVVDHVARVEGVIAGLVTGMVDEARARGIGAETETGSVLTPAILAMAGDRSVKLQAPEPAHPAADARYEDAVAALDASHRRVVEALAAAEGLALGTVQMRHPALGALNVYEWGVAVGGHEARHAAQIQEAAAALSSAGV
jgi:hypothetical protein